MQKDEFCWYASYGSNMLEQRFLCYITGGSHEGNSKIHKGCEDKSLPIATKPITIPHDLYFAKSSKSWNNEGVAFLNPIENKDASTLGRMYLIKKSQLIDIVQQENDLTTKPEIDFNQLEAQGRYIIDEKLWYGLMLCLGWGDNYPIFTFTHFEMIKEQNSPDPKYLATLKNGLLETYPLRETAIDLYLNERQNSIS